MDTSISNNELANFKEKVWTTYEGISYKHKNLTDDHLINIIYHIQQVPGNLRQYRLFLELALERGLTQTDLDRAQIPHRNKSGNLVMMSYDQDKFGKTFQV